MKKVLLICALAVLSGFVFGQETETLTETSAETTVLTEEASAVTAETESEITENNDEIQIEVAVENETASEIVAESELSESTNEISEENTENENLVQNTESQLPELLSTEQIERQTKNEQFSKMINTYVSEKDYELKDFISPLEIINYIELAKTNIYNQRKEILEKETLWNRAKDSEVDAQVDEILNSPLEAVEKDAFGTQTKESIAYRKAKAQEVINQAEKDKTEYSRQLWDSIKNDEKEKLNVLKKFYSALELYTYKSSTFTDEMTLTFSSFDGKTGKWTAKVCANLFDVENILNESFELSYSDVTGKKITSLDKMKPEQFKEYNENIKVYDYLFQNDVPVIYAKMTYKICVWQNASEYRFMPSKIEIFKIEEGKSKKIKTLGYLPSKVFTRFPTVEIRDEKAIAAQKQKTVNKLEKEQKQKEKRLGVKLYSDPDVAAKTYGKAPVIQKGRGTVLISVADLENFDAPAFGLDLLRLDTTFGLGKFGFIGFDLGMNLTMNNNQRIFYGGLLGGVNFHAGRLFRPYIFTGADYYSDYTIAAKAGAGCDLVLAKVFCINLNYTFNWNMGAEEYLNKEARLQSIAKNQDLQLPMWDSHLFSVGLGVAW